MVAAFVVFQDPWDGEIGLGQMGEDGGFGFETVAFVLEDGRGG